MLLRLVLKTSQYRVIYFRIYTSYYVGLSIKKDFAILYVKKSVFYTAVVSITSVLSIYTIIMLDLVLKKLLGFLYLKKSAFYIAVIFIAPKQSVILNSVFFSSSV